MGDGFQIPSDYIYNMTSRLELIQHHVLKTIKNTCLFYIFSERYIMTKITILRTKFNIFTLKRVFKVIYVSFNLLNRI